MATQTYESVEEIERDFIKRRRAADTPEEENELRLQEREAKAEFREREATRKALDAHRTQAVASAGLDPEIAEMVAGSTPEEIDASVVKIKAWQEKVKAPPSGQAAELYGGATGGGGTPPIPEKGSRVQFEEDFIRRFNNREALSPREISRFMQQQLGAQVAQSFKDQGLKRWKDLDISEYYKEREPE